MLNEAIHLQLDVSPHKGNSSYPHVKSIRPAAVPDTQNQSHPVYDCGRNPSGASWLPKADVTLDDGPHFLRAQLARTLRFLRVSGSVIHVSQVTRSRFNSLPVVLPLPSALPAAAACAPQSAFGHTNPKNYVTLAHSTCSCPSLSHRQRRRHSPPVDTDSRPPAPCPSPLCTSTVTLTSYGGPHTVGL
jgi:hypothetical protein